MNWIAQNLWLIPALPLLAAGLSAPAKQRHRTFAAALAIGSMVAAFLMSCAAFAATLGRHGEAARQVHNFDWFVLGDTTLKLGWVLDPLAAAMLVMVTCVGALIFIYSLGYMAQDENFTRFFCFLSLFAAAMLGLVIANNLLLLFMCWELVGLASYLLIGFWYHKPSASAAAKKAFITTRIGDVFFFLGMVWLYAETGTLLFYDAGNGCLEQSALAKLVGLATGAGMAAATAISLLIFCGAIGKSGQVPLHVWLPDAMEGPTPVSALIHAATMVAAGVFLVARVYPLMEAGPGQSVAVEATRPAKPDSAAQAAPTRTAALSLSEREKPLQIVGNSNASELAVAAKSVPPLPQGEGRREAKTTPAHHGGASASTALKAVTWVGAVTAVFAALIAVAQTDIKRILAYSTVSQLGYMFMGLGVGGVAVGMFHLITHAFFKALLFLGAGSVIHGCHKEQDIRRMGGVRKFMPATFATYAVGMMALSGVPLVFSGFWSKDEILHAAWLWEPSQWPFALGLFGALLTAFYMTRQMCYVFFGEFRGRAREGSGHSAAGCEANPRSHRGSHDETPHESPPVMTAPLMILAFFSVLLGFVGTPAWPWFHDYLTGHTSPLALGKLLDWGTFSIMALSTVVVGAGLVLGWWFYGLEPPRKADETDPLEQWRPSAFAVLRSKFYMDELYDATLVRFNAWSSWVCDRFDRGLLNGAVRIVSSVILGLSWLTRFIDEYLVNGLFDEGCRRIRLGGRFSAGLQAGQVQSYLRVIGLALTSLLLFLTWGCGS